MCARRFLILIFILTLIFVGGAFALYQWGDQILVRMATPRGHYREPPKESTPDYAKAESWIARPDFKDDPTKWLPSDAGLPLHPSHAAAFYVHPTTYLERDHWNAPLIGNAEADRRAELFVRSQGSAMRLAGVVWAPRYRQAAYGAFLLKSEDARKALELAYGDVRDAFDAFLAAQPKDAPMIVAGHSQGSMHVLRLLTERSVQLKGRLVAAYIIGWPVGVTSDLPATGFPACTEPDEAGCVVSWQSFKEPANTRLVTKAWVGTVGLTGKTRTRGDMLCTNPLTGTKDGAGPVTANDGTLVPNGDLTEAKLESGRVSANCDKGFLIIDGDVPNMGPYVLPGNNYHVYDYALFWGSMRANAKRRTLARQAR